MDMFPTTYEVDIFPTTYVSNFIATTHVETVCLLSRLSNRKPDSYVNLSVDMDEYRKIMKKQ